MNIHRLTTANLPAIRVHDLNSVDSPSDSLSSSFSQRSMPREIPIPRYGSPTSSRGGSLHGSIPPILSLEPPGAQLASSHYHAFTHPDSLQSSFGGDDSGSEGQRPRKVVLDIRDRRREPWSKSPITPGSFGDRSASPSFGGDGFSLRSEESIDRDWRQAFYKKHGQRPSPNELLSADSLRNQVQQSVNAYDRRLLSKLDTTSTSEPSLARPMLMPTPPRASFGSENRSLPPLPLHWQQKPPISRAVSPRITDSPVERWTPAESVSSERDWIATGPTPRTRTPFLTPTSNEGGSLPSVFPHSNHERQMRRSASASVLEDEDSRMGDSPSHVSRMGQLSLHEARTPPQSYQRKRRASSPPHDDPLSKGPLLERASPKVFHPLTSSSSFTSASASSGATYWSSASASTSVSTLDWGSPATIHNFFSADDVKKERASRIRLSPGKDTTTPPDRKLAVFMCECCPKKPKKFSTRSDLQLHELEKQYTCLYCHNRFKNKNEAERHQNSLHLRKHSWSCSSLSRNYEAAYNNEICGYCGIAVEWNKRIEHLTKEHKFGECNQTKKFWRADHFRQHLKHSHAGTSGKWTNGLEMACMREEALPVPIRGGRIEEEG